jgi:hypothetical protein
MWSYVVVEQLVARKNRGIGILERAHNLFSVSDFSVEPFHLVIVVLTLKRYAAFSGFGKPKCGNWQA